MNERQAQLILETVKEAGKYPDPIPGFEDELIEVAEELVSEAYTASRKGARGDLVTRILWLAQEEDASVIANELFPSAPELDEDDNNEKLNDDEREKDNLDSFPQDGTSKIEAAYAAKVRANARIKKENLPVPPEIDGEAPVLPRDLTKSSDVDIRRLSSEFNACLARANYLVALEEADELVAKQLSEYHHARAIKLIGARGEKLTKPVMDAEAADDPDYKLWRERQTDHHVSVRVLKSLRDTYQGNCERLSREWTMRTEERQVTR